MMTDTTEQNDKLISDAITKFLFGAEANIKDIYHDKTPAGYPTHGYGVRLDDKDTAFLRAYLDSLEKHEPDPKKKIKADDIVTNYVYNTTTEKWEESGTGKLINVLESLLKGNENRPFTPKNGIPDNAAVRLEHSKNTNELAFKEVVYESYLNGSSTLGITGVAPVLGDSWKKLSLHEKTAVYAIHYNLDLSQSQKLVSALQKYTALSGNAKFIAQIEAIVCILYRTNSGNNNIVQNRRFAEAREFLGYAAPTKTIDSTNAVCEFPFSNLEEAKIVVSFMKKYYDQMLSKLSSVIGYKKDPLKYLRDNFYDAIHAILVSEGLENEYSKETLFTGWNIHTSFDLNTHNGKTGGVITGAASNKSIINGTELNDIIICESNNSIHSGNMKNTINGGDGDDIIYAGKGDDVINGGVGADKLYGGSGNDHLTGGKNNDILEGGAGSDLLRRISLFRRVS